MENINLQPVWKVTLETLSPIHIGVSQEKFWQWGIDYFIKNNTVYLFKPEKIFSEVPDEEKEKYITYLGKGELHLFNEYMIKQRNIDITENAYKNFPINEQEIKEIRPMTSTNGNINIIPSSSIKGSVRTAFLSHLIHTLDSYALKKENITTPSYKEYRFTDEKIQKFYLGNDPKKDLFRLVRFSDFYFKEDTTFCAKLQILNLEERGWKYKNAQFLYAECLKAHQKAQGTLQIPEVLLQETSKKGIIRHTNLLAKNTFISIVNTFTKELIQDELEFWEGEDKLPPFVEQYVEYLTTILHSISEKSKNECLLRVGAGAGWDFVTGAWAKEEDRIDDDTWEALKKTVRKGKSYESGIPFPKTRKLTSTNEPLGFVKIMFED
jgi:CRISPR type III-A-associated RAMP protein Csm5